MRTAPTVPTHRTRRGAGALVLGVLLGLALGGCGDETPAEGTTTTNAPGTGSEVTLPDAPGSFQLTTADGAVAIAGSARTCELADESSASIRFTGSVVDVVVEAEGGRGTVTLGDTFTGAVDSVSADLDTGEVVVQGEGSSATEEDQRTRFTVEGRCPR